MNEMSEQGQIYLAYVEALESLPTWDRSIVADYVGAVRRECSMRRQSMRHDEPDLIAEKSRITAMKIQKELLPSVEALLAELAKTDRPAVNAIYAHIKYVRQEAGALRIEAADKARSPQARAAVLINPEVLKMLTQIAADENLDIDMTPEAILERVVKEFSRPRPEPIKPGNGSVYAFLAGLPGHGKRR